MTMTKYSEVVKEVNRFMRTFDPNESKRWREILDEHLIRYRSLGKTENHKCAFIYELVGYSWEENEKIKDLVGYYYDEEEAE